MIASLITILYLLGTIPPENAWTFLYIYAFLLVAGEIALGGHGILVFNALLAAWIGYVIQTGTFLLFGLPLDWSLLFGIAFVETVLTIAFIAVTLHYRKIKASTGTAAMIGGKASVITWNSTSGTVLIDGETWKARSDTALELSPDEKIIVKAVEGLTLVVSH